MIADVPVRNRGTLGGALCQADPSEDLSGVCTTLDARCVIRSSAGERVVSMDDFHRGPYQTAVGQAEMLTEVRIPVRPHGSSAYAKVDRRAGDWAVVAAGAAVWLDGRRHRRRPGRAGRGRPQHHRHPGDLRARCAAGRRDEEAWAEAGRIAAAQLQAGHRRPGHRGLQAPPRRRAHPAHAAHRRRAGCGEGAGMKVTITVNDELFTREVEARLLLVHFLRDELGLTGTHWGCDTSNCGACVVLYDGEPVKSCTVLAAMADGHEVRTVEDLEHDGVLDPVQQGFMECHGLQCGFCTPGMLMSARALLDRDPHPTDQTIREAISGQICRCTGYATIVRSVQWAAEHPDGTSRGMTADRASTDRGRWATAGCSARRTGGSCAARAATATTSSSRDAPPRRAPLAGRARPHRHASTPPPPRRTRRSRRSSPARCSPSAAWPGCRRSPATCRRCWPPTRSGSRARRSPSSSPRTATPRATRSS